MIPSFRTQARREFAAMVREEFARVNREIEKERAMCLSDVKLESEFKPCNSCDVLTDSRCENELCESPSCEDCRSLLGDLELCIPCVQEDAKYCRGRDSAGDRCDNPMPCRTHSIRDDGDDRRDEARDEPREED